MLLPWLLLAGVLLWPQAHVLSWTPLLVLVLALVAELLFAIAVWCRVRGQPCLIEAPNPDAPWL